MSGIVSWIALQLRYLLLAACPKNLLSRIVGKFSRRPWSVSIVPWFVERYRINTDEAALPVSEYSSLHDFFVRDLKPGVREIYGGSSSDVIVSPADGMLTQCGAIENGTLLQVKGKTYKLSELLCSEVEALKFDAGSYFTIYLAPGDYHHVHSPCTAAVNALKLIPGTLWPVNSWSVCAIDKLFCKNERMIITLGEGDTLYKVIMVGATNVGSISVTFDEMVSNTSDRSVRERSYANEILMRRGERLGTFHLGSTVVVLINKQFNKYPEVVYAPKLVKYGQVLVDGER